MMVAWNFAFFFTVTTLTSIRVLTAASPTRLTFDNLPFNLRVFFFARLETARLALLSLQVLEIDSALTTSESAFLSVLLRRRRIVGTDVVGSPNVCVHRIARWKHLLAFVADAFETTYRSCGGTR